MNKFPEMDVEQQDEVQQSQRDDFSSIVSLLLGQLSIVAVAISIELFNIVSDIIAVAAATFVRVILDWFFRYSIFF